MPIYLPLRYLRGRHLQVTGWGLPELRVSEVLVVVAGGAGMSLSSHKDLTRYLYVRWPLKDSVPEAN